MNNDTLGSMLYGYGDGVTAARNHTLPNGHEFIMRIKYTNKEDVGVMVLVIASCLSLLAAMGLLIAMLTSAIITRAAPKNSRLFVRTHIAPYFASLLVCDILQAIGSIMNARWVAAHAVQYGQFCLIQGAIKQASDVGAAIWTLIIAIHTFNVLFLEIIVPRVVMYVTLVGGWAVVGTLVIGGPATQNTNLNGPFFGISGYWCWISPEYPIHRITLDYMQMFISGGICFVLYVLIFLRVRGNITREGGRLRFRPKAFNPASGTRQEQYGRTVARRMVWYPVAYTALLLPIAVARFISWSGHEVEFEGTIFCDTIFLLSGVVNVTMFLSTRTLLPQRALPAVSAPQLKSSTVVVVSEDLESLPSDSTSSRYSTDDKSMVSYSNVQLGTPITFSR